MNFNVIIITTKTPNTKREREICNQMNYNNNKKGGKNKTPLPNKYYFLFINEPKLAKLIIF
jgi:hypothetical protein